MALANDGQVGLTNRFLVTAMGGWELGYFSKVEGLKVTWEMPDYRAGDSGNQRLFAPAYTKYPDVKLTRAAHPTDSPKVQKFLADNSTKHEYGIITIALYGPHNDAPVVTWECKDAVPLEWSIQSFDSTSSNIALETFVFTHNGFLADDFKIA